jgi:hypothetical protein
MSESEKRYLPMQYDKKGNPSFSCHLSPTDQTQRAHCAIRPTDVIPVIFVPGFMGSNLKTTKGAGSIKPNEFCWCPDDNSMMLSKVAKLSAAERQAAFSPATTVVASVDKLPKHLMQQFNFSGRDYLDLEEQIIDNLLGEFKRRGWGEVYLGSYGRVLGSLEARLNRIYRQGKLEDSWREVMEQVNVLFDDRTKENERLERSGIPSHGQNRAKGWSPLTEADLKASSRRWFPVHAFGYNWLESSAVTGKALAQRIREVIDSYAKQSYACTKVILVTHSMGGLVARAACHPTIGGAESSVLGVVQGVCPTAGAPAIYQRMRTGHATGIFLEFVKNKVAEIMGTDAARVTPVLGNSPGALELLPTTAYPADWLAIDGTGALPKANPYAEIYRERNAWWKLVKEELLNPAGLRANDTSPWDSYIASIARAELIHGKVLGNTHHPNTHAHYSVASDDEAVAEVRWRHKPNGPNRAAPAAPLQLTQDDLKGEVKLRAADGSQHSFELERTRRTKGDGTVPADSAVVTEKAARFSAALEIRFKHSDSYEDKDVIALTLHNITRMAAQA